MAAAKRPCRDCGAPSRIYWPKRYPTPWPETDDDYWPYCLDCNKPRTKAMMLEWEAERALIPEEEEE